MADKGTTVITFHIHVKWRYTSLNKGVPYDTNVPPFYQNMV
jgi:hypothetical protein